MNGSLATRRRSNAYYYGWGVFFFIVIFSVISMLYLATIQIDYVWRWYKMPSYFLNHETIEIHSQMEGEVDEILVQDDKATIRVKGSDETETTG